MLGLIFAVAGLLLLVACKSNPASIKLAGSAALRLADGSPISLANTNEYNPYFVRMPDGFLMLVFGSDRSCGGCTGGTHNIFIARSVAVYNDDGKLPAFNTPTVFTVAGTPLNAAGTVSFVATKNSVQLRIYLVNAGLIRYADLVATVAPYNTTALSSIAQFSLVRSSLLGIDASGVNLFARSDKATQAFYFDPTLNTNGMTRLAVGAEATSVVQVAANIAGQSDAFFFLKNGQVTSLSHAAQGAAATQVNTAVQNSKVSLQSMSVLSTGVKAGDLILLSGTEAGSAQSDLYVLDGTNAGVMWEQLASRPPSSIAAPPDWTQPQLTATRVYGQNGLYNCNVQNNNHTGCVSGGQSDRNFFVPFRVSVSDSGIYVADQQNNRALYFPGTSLIATRVYCQAGNFTTGTFGVAPNSQTCRGSGSYGNVPSVFADTSGLYVNDIEGNRILFFSGTNIDAALGSGRVYGQAGSYTTFAINNPALGNQSVYYPDSVTADATGVYVADTFNHRVLHFPGTSTTADRVYGQPDFTTNTSGTSAIKMQKPRGVAIAPDGIYVSDTENNRILFFPGTSTTATRVYGQSDFISNSPGVTASKMNWPWGIRYFGGGIYVADPQNHRVLYFPVESASATRVWGQAGSFTANTVNNGGISASSLNTPSGLDIDETGLYVGDSANNRVLFFPR
ncbi:MAG: hypothetical protein ACOY5B_03035 [Spirochaetota bacterium]